MSIMPGGLRKRDFPPGENLELKAGKIREFSVLRRGKNGGGRGEN
jgi:hypothetical protein